MLATTQDGKLMVHKDGALLSKPALDLAGKVCTNGGRGLLGVAVDPNFQTNNYVYLYYTFKKYPGCEQKTANLPVNRVERYVLSGSNTATPDKVLVDNMQNVDIHSAGDLRFGKDGYLYVTVGDGGCYYADFTKCGPRNPTAQNTNVLMGKILRVTRDGGIPATNPYQGTDSARCNTGMIEAGKKCQEIFASGVRNPFRFAFDPDAAGTRFFVNDVGQGLWEEVNEGRAGANYGWSHCEGSYDNPNNSGTFVCDAAPYTPPVHEYNHDAGCSSITGGAFVPNGLWPARYDDSYLFADYVCGKIFELSPDGVGGLQKTEFASGLGASTATAMSFGPHADGQALYYATYGNGGEIRRIAYVGDTNRPPTAAVTATPTSGPSPLAVDFDGSGSNDPDAGDTLTYLWDFDGNGTTDQTTTTPTTSHTYSTDGAYTASLRVRDNQNTVSDTATVRIDAGNGVPVPVIESPVADLLFKVGQDIALRGSATDPEDGPIAGESLEWEVLQHHTAPNPHTHPLLLSGTGNDLAFKAPAPEDLTSTGAGNYLEVKLTATDSNGRSETVSRIVQPNRVQMKFETQPNSGLNLEVEGATVTTAPEKTLTSWEGYELDVVAPSPQTLGGTTYEFSSWSDGGTQSHRIVTGAEASTLTATYKVASTSCTITGTSANDTLTGTAGDDVICGGGGNDTIKGAGGNDTLKGEAGVDKLSGGTGSDTLDGGLNNDIADFSGSLTAVTASLTSGTATGEGSDTMTSVEWLTGSPKNDMLTGNGGNNTLNGGGGADTIDGLAGADKPTGAGGLDMLHGGLGNDTVVGGGSADNLFGDEGDDTVNSKDNVSGNDSLDGGAHVNGDTAVTDATEKSIIGFP
jgi:glucose/arabinose dehydrogenase/PKD repeat protein